MRGSRLYKGFNQSVNQSIFCNLLLYLSNSGLESGIDFSFLTGMILKNLIVHVKGIPVSSTEL